MLALLIYAAPFALGIVLLYALVATIGNFRQARSAPYFSFRRAAARSGRQWLLVSLVSAAGIYVALSAQPLVEPPDLTWLIPKSAPVPSPTFSLESILTVTPGTGIATKDPLFSPPTITPTQPTATVLPTPIIATIQSAVTPLPGALLKISAVTTSISASLQPVGTGTSFPAGVPRFYVFFDYENMTNGVSWSRVVILDGKVVRTETEAWQNGPQGVNRYFFFDATGGGWPAGLYVIQFYLGDDLASETTFNLK